ncbi:copper chaperone PCu(A)C [Leptospira ilyithenensis]|uniref:copper chaperone PCu(A)C n=1 Tax=Leptospira ilyithenensis TaxID=2484901 RepID=UPI00143868CC|nr:copper chaperone PCu(A)C [Leptospira ilyithenensis]
MTEELLVQKEESGILAGFRVRKIHESATVTAGYGKITNLRDADTEVREIRAEGYETVEWHTSSLEDGIAKMRKVDFPIPLPSGKEILLDKGGNHLMLIGKKKKISETVRIYFVLSNGETLVWDAAVK